MATTHDLRLHEEALLLALKDKAGTPATSMYAYAVGGAILAELLLEERVRLVARRRGGPLLESSTGASPVGNPVLDAALRLVRDAKRRASAVTWIGRFSRRERLRETARGLVHKGILRVEEKRLLLLFRRTVYPELDPAPERRLLERVREAVFGDGPVDTRTATLVGIAHSAGLLAPLLGRKALKGRNARLKTLLEDNVAADATRATIQAVQAAVVAATSAATSAAASGG